MLRELLLRLASIETMRTNYVLSLLIILMLSSLK